MATLFSDNFKKTLELAREEAARLGDNFVAPEHLMLGILRHNSNTAIEILISAGIDPDDIRKTLVEMMDHGDEGFFRGNIVVTSRAQKMTEYAAAEARNSGSPRVGTEHLLLAILKGKESKNLSAQALLIYNLTYRDAVRHLAAIRSAGRQKRKPRHSKNDILESFSRDITAQAIENKLDPVIGRNREIERVTQILCRRKKNNPVLIGEPGVGKTAIVEGFAQRVARKEVPYLLQNKKIVSLDLAAMVAGTKYRGQFEERIKEILDEIIKDGEIVIFIDELHTIVGAGGAEGTLDASNILKPMLASGELQIIGATTAEEYRRYIEKDGALERRFQTIYVDPPSYKETVEILNGLRPYYEEHHKIKITDKAIETAVRLSDRFIQGRYQPDKAIDLLDETGSMLNLAEYVKPVDILKLEAKVAEKEQEKQKLVAQQDFEKAASIRDEIIVLQKNLINKERVWHRDRDINRPTMIEENVAGVCSKISGVPMEEMNKEDQKRLLNMADELSKYLVGQNDAVDAITNAIKRSRSGLGNPNRPVGSFLFLGPSGVGKTEMAKVLTKFLFGSVEYMVRIDMSEYMEKFSVSRLVGAPPGYVGYEEGGTLTEAVRRHPYSVVLFDEIEKAHPDVFNLLLQILEDGILTDSLGRRVDFKNTIVIMTSNIGTSELISKRLGFDGDDNIPNYETMREQILSKVNHILVPEFVNRIDEIIVFRSLSTEDIEKIVDIQIEELNKRVAHKDISLILTDEVRKWLANKGYNPNMGARLLSKVIQQFIENALSEKVLAGEIPWEHIIKIELDIRNNTLIFIPVESDSKGAMNNIDEVFVAGE
ncbi:ATP-dependent Clp protease ATP-binding subunit [bacterium]|nr:ATP-dependent Clp protease ATP-binding subunit [bacterium]